MSCRKRSLVYELEENVAVLGMTATVGRTGNCLDRMQFHADTSNMHAHMRPKGLKKNQIKFQRENEKRTNGCTNSLLRAKNSYAEY